MIGPLGLLSAIPGHDWKGKGITMGVMCNTIGSIQWLEYINWGIEPDLILFRCLQRRRETNG